ncbi:MAG TPA: hypothetical protein VI258_00680, partial [Rhodanobacteraceae bacterium]
KTDAKTGASKSDAMKADAGKKPAPIKEPPKKEPPKNLPKKGATTFNVPPRGDAFVSITAEREVRRGNRC